MSRCPKCGAEVTDEMSFCANCGAALRVAQPPAGTRPPEYGRHEKAEKTEKHEKGEKREKGEVGFLGPLIGGLILICLGTALYLQMTGMWEGRSVGAFFLILVGVIIIIAALYGAYVLSKRHPRP